MLTIRRCAGCGKEFDAEVGTPDRVCFACRDVLGDWDGEGSQEKIGREKLRNRRGETWEEQAQRIVPFPVSWTVKMKKKQKETQDILSYHSQAAGCSDKARAKASGGRQPIEECGRTGL